MSTTLSNLTQGTPTAGSSVPFFDVANGADRRVSLNGLAAAIDPLLTASQVMTQYAAPAATGFSVTVAPAVAGQSVFLLLTPVAGYAAGTIVLPAVATCVDKQEVTITSTQNVNALTVSGNGAPVNGAPTVLGTSGAPVFARLRFDAVLSSWYRVG
jgi:hypothetical protein